MKPLVKLKTLGKICAEPKLNTCHLLTQSVMIAKNSPNFCSFGNSLPTLPLVLMM